MRVVFMGTPEFAVAPLEYLVLNRYEVIAVYTQPDKMAGRGQAISAPVTKSAANKFGLHIAQPATLKSLVARARLEELNPDVIVVAAYGKILPESVLAMPVYGCLNIHPSLLPRYRGVAPIPAAILNGDEFTGVTIMQMDSGVDTGPILAQAQVPVSERDTTGLLTEKLSRIGAQLLIDVLPRWTAREIKPRSQNSDFASYTHLISKEAGEINWQDSASDIARQVRAYQPWPGSHTRWQGKQLKIIEAVPVNTSAEKAGRVVLLKDKAAFGVETGCGILGVVKVQLEGKRAMNADEFLRGQRQLIGAILPA